MNPPFEVRGRRLGPLSFASTFLGILALTWACFAVLGLIGGRSAALYQLPVSLGFSYLFIIFIPRMAGTTVLIVIDDSSILSTMRSARPIPFAAISEARWLKLQVQSFLCLRLRDPDAYPPDSGLRAFDKLMTRGDVQIALRFLDTPDTEIVEAFMLRSGIAVEGWEKA